VTVHLGGCRASSLKQSDADMDLAACNSNLLSNVHSQLSASCCVPNTLTTKTTPSMLPAIYIVLLHRAEEFSESYTDSFDLYQVVVLWIALGSFDVNKLSLAASPFGHVTNESPNINHDSFSTPATSRPSILSYLNQMFGSSPHMHSSSHHSSKMQSMCLQLLHDQAVAVLL